MSTEARIGLSEKPVECRDERGSELFPADDIAAMIDMITWLEPEFEDPSLVGDLIDDIGVTASNIAVSHNRAIDLRHHDQYWLKMQLSVRQDVMHTLHRKQGRFPDPFGVVKEAVRGLAPAEIDFFKALTSGENPGFQDEDFIRAGQLEQPSKIAKIAGKAPRLHGNTPENLEKLAEVTDAARYLMLFEGHNRAAKVLDLCMVFGGMKHTDTAISLLNRLRKISCSGENIHERMMAQAQADGDILRLAGSLPYSTMDDTTRRYINRRVDHFHSIADANLNLSWGLFLTTYGRAFRLNGDRHPEGAVTTRQVEPEIEPPVEVSQPPETGEKPEPKPDFLAECKAKLQHLVDSVNFPKFELLPTKEIKRRLLDEARRVLVKGETDIHGNQLVGGRSKIETHRYISSIEFLRSFIPSSGDLTAAKEKLDQAVSDSARHAGQLEELFGEAESRLSSRLLNDFKSLAPENGRLSDLVAYIKDDWDTASHVIRNYWPDGRRVAEQLSQLLFPTEASETAAVPQDGPVELVHDQEVRIR